MIFCRYASYKVTAQATLIFSDLIIPTCGILKFPSARLLISSETPLCSFPKTRATGWARSISYKFSASLPKYVVKIFAYFFLSSEKHSGAFSNWWIVSHFAALEELLGPHFL